ncbi:MAG: pyridoxal-dependent decarboxylase, exosortase system-associated, partial [Rhodoferax sp.]|nr:pyridoxal-dependent decarboxylase, exosortase system-associated [Rhodoferax sp.]
DLLADRMDLPVAQEGDLVVVFKSGAYGASASPHGFLGHPPCVEVLV